MSAAAAGRHQEGAGTWAPLRAAALVGPREYHRVATRLAFRTLTTTPVRRFAKRITGRPDLTK